MKPLLSLLPALLPLLFAGCSHDADAVPDSDGAAGDTVTLSFQMVSANVGDTRSDSYPEHPEEDSQWEFEDYINLKDFAFYIFVENGTADTGDDPLVARFDDISSSADPNKMVTGGNGVYTVTVAITRKDLDTLLGHEITAQSTGSVTFRIAVLANALYDAAAILDDGTPFSYATLAPHVPAAGSAEATAATTFGEFLASAGKIVYSLSNIHEGNESGDSQVDGIYKGSIPMFGIKSFEVAEEQLFASRPEERIFLGTVSMLRSLAKVRVYDRAPKDAAGYPRVTDVSVVSQTDRSYMLPANAGTYSDGWQVHQANVAAPTASAALYEFKLGYLPGEQADHIGYLPEQALATEQPALKITVETEKGSSDTHTVPLYGGSQYMTAGFGSSNSEIVRNHIYEVTVNSIDTGTPGRITVRVAAWDESEIILEYTEVVSVSRTDGKAINWSGHDGYYPSTGSLVLKPWSSDGQQVPVAGTFLLESPAGATWTAFLLDREGGTGRFTFLDAAGNALGQSVSGTVGYEATLRIASTDGNPAEAAQAQLQIVVALANGTYIDADITDINTPDYNKFTIVQNKPL